MILNSLKSLKTVLRKEKPSGIIIVSSSTLIKKLDWAIKEMALPNAQIVEIPDGEAAKDWAVAEKLLKSFIDCNLDRNGMVIALGGGTVGDVVGFVSSVYLRGVRYVQVPTTLLAQVDSAHGGKTAIDFMDYKNQVGTFYPPIAIIIDQRFVKSLSEEQVIDGLGEVIKAGLIKDPKILDLLKGETTNSLLKSKKLESIIKRSIKVKQYYVNKDFEDNGMRQMLNFGHTFGHAVELKYGISHGRAVIIGMLLELKAFESLKMTPVSVRTKLEILLKSLGIKIDAEMKIEFESILHDKKVNGEQIYLPIVTSIGKSKMIRLDVRTLQISNKNNL